MENVLLVAYLLIVLALIAVILLQRSEGGGLGMGGNAGGLMTVRGSANLLTRTTAVLAALFFVTAIGLTILAELNRTTSDSILDHTPASPTAQPATVLDALSQMGRAPRRCRCASDTAADAERAGRLPTPPPPRRPRPGSRPSGHAARRSARPKTAPPASSARPSKAPAAYELRRRMETSPSSLGETFRVARLWAHASKAFRIIASPPIR